MTIQTPTRAELTEELQAYLAARLPGIAVGDDTEIGARIAMFREALFGLYSQIGSVQDDLFVSDRTSTEGLDSHADARLTGGRKASTTSTGIDAVRATGTINTTIPSGSELIASDGTRFATSAAATIITGTTVDLSVQSIDTGTICNRAIGESLTFVSPPSGIESTASVIAAIDGAEDWETDGALVRRLLDAYKNPAAGGRFSDWRQWATSITGVDTAYAYGPSSVATTGRRGLGIVDVAILASGTGANRIPTAAVQQDVEDYLDTVRPAMTTDYGVILPDVLSQAIDVQLTVSPSHNWDWAATAAHVATAYDSGLQRITVGVTPECAAGDRVMVLGQLAIVSSVDLVNDYIFVDTALTGSITGETVYPGGPVSDPCHESLQDLFDDLGPAKGTAADPDQDWDDTLRLAAIFDAVMDVPGVVDATIVTPATNVVPSDTGSTIELLVASTITVRPA